MCAISLTSTESDFQFQRTPGFAPVVSTSILSCVSELRSQSDHRLRNALESFGERPLHAFKCKVSRPLSSRAAWVTIAKRVGWPLGSFRGCVARVRTSALQSARHRPWWIFRVMLSESASVALAMLLPTCALQRAPGGYSFPVREQKPTTSEIIPVQLWSQRRSCGRSLKIVPRPSLQDLFPDDCANWTCSGGCG